MNRNRLIAILFLLALSLGAGERAPAQQPVSSSNDRNGSARSADEIQLSRLLAQAHAKRRTSFSLMPENRNPNLNPPGSSITPAAGPGLSPVIGSGTLGRLTKWGPFTGSNSVIVDSTIYEDKFGKVGVGTDSPTSKLTVAGMIEAKGTDAGIKFPDGSVQMTSASGALLGVAHDQTLTGNGTSASPIGVASPLMVRDLDNPARQPFHFTYILGADPFTVPAGKRLVIEFVTGAAHVADFDHLRDRKTFPVVLNHSGEPFDTIYFVVGDIIEALPGGRSYGISQMVRLYADPGSVVRPFGSGTTITFGTLTLSGYFVDIPQPQVE